MIRISIICRTDETNHWNFPKETDWLVVFSSLSFQWYSLGFEKTFPPICIINSLRFISNANNSIRSFCTIDSLIELDLHYCLTCLSFSSCSNDTCQTINRNEMNSILLYAIPFDRKHEDSARDLFHRSDGCIPLNRFISRLWLKWTWNRTIRTQFSQVRYKLIDSTSFFSSCLANP